MRNCVVVVWGLSDGCRRSGSGSRGLGGICGRLDSGSKRMSGGCGRLGSSIVGGWEVVARGSVVVVREWQ